MILSTGYTIKWEKHQLHYHFRYHTQVMLSFLKQTTSLNITISNTSYTIIYESKSNCTLIYKIIWWQASAMLSLTTPNTSYPVISATKHWMACYLELKSRYTIISRKLKKKISMSSNLLPAQKLLNPLSQVPNGKDTTSLIWLDICFWCLVLKEFMKSSWGIYVCVCEALECNLCCIITQ